MQILDIADEHYKAIFAGQYGVGHKQYLGPQKPATCRFCGKSTPEITFKHKAHAIPELLGNRQLIITDECDSCNSFFAEELEDHLGKFLKPFRTIGMVKGKTGYPSYLSAKGSDRIDISSSTSFNFFHSEDSGFIVDAPEKKELTVNLLIERHIPAAAFKALIKVALSVMPQSDLKDFSDALRWIRQPTHTHMLVRPLTVLASFVPGFKPFPNTFILLLRKKSDSPLSELPACQLVLGFGNLLLQLTVPTRLDCEGQGEHAQFTFTTRRIGVALEKFSSAVRHYDWDFSSNVVVEPRAYPIKIIYAESEDIGPQTR
jgi:hypothetical protein